MAVSTGTGRKPGRHLCALFLGAALAASASAMPAEPSRPGLEERVIVKFREAKGDDRGPSIERARAALAAAAERRGVKLEELRQLATGGRVFRVQGASGEHRELVAQLRGHPDIEYAEEDRILKAYATPNDTRYGEQWHYFEATGGLRANTAWDQAIGTGVRVAVLDTGYRPHADLAANIVGGYDMIADTFVSNDGNGRDSDAQDPGDWATAGQCGTGEPASNSSWHGTHVAGTVAAVTNNGSGVAGVAYGAKVVPVRVLGRCGGYTSDIADGIIWAAGGSVSGVPANANPAKVVSLSLGGGGACDSTSQSAINTARSLGAVVIIAAGNENQNVSNSSPANCAGVVAVAATNRAGGRAYYSNYGTLVDVAGPGGAQSFANDPEGILSTVNTGTQGPVADGYAFFQGTSMATPHVSGVAALMLQKKPTATPDEIEATLKSSARAFPATCSGCGTGIVDANAAVTAIGGGGGGGGGTVLTDGVAVTGLAGSAGTELRYTIVVPTGQASLTVTQSGGSGDADLYVKFGSAPTTASYDCRPYKSGNAESCTYQNPTAGTYHIMVRGYSAFSGVSLLGDYAAATGGSCAAGFTQYTGTLSAGGNAYVPGTGGYVSSISGTHSGRLSGPSGTDFDLYLQKLSGSTWSSVKSSLGSTSTESVDYAGTSGTYRWRVYAYSGSGSYTLCTKKP